jgi:hypothetical protein
MIQSKEKHEYVTSPISNIKTWDLSQLSSRYEHDVAPHIVQIEIHIMLMNLD